MRTLFIFWILIFCHTAYAQIPKEDIKKIGQQIFINECGGKISHLTSWNEGESFASLGIGHFIWYPKENNGPFNESFPKLISFIQDHSDYPVPAWIKNSPCPWNSKKEFYQSIDTKKMQQLRLFLQKTMPLQTLFIVNRLTQSLPNLIKATEIEKRNHIRTTFNKLLSTPNGAYALIDYVNFKGEGILASERYNGQGWGLLQVLKEMDENVNDNDIISSFVKAADTVLTRRVLNAPASRNEDRWLLGWRNRLNTYKNFTNS